jgi:hypothetical protein
MMDESLPSDLNEAERNIGSLMRFDPEGKFGRRIIGAMRNEMRRERTAARWKFSLGLAAGAFLWLHLSFYVAPVTDFHFRSSLPARGMSCRAIDSFFQSSSLTDLPPN